MTRVAFVALVVGLLVVGVGAGGGSGSSLGDCSGGSIMFVSDRSGEVNHGEVDAIDPCGTRTRQLVRDANDAMWSPDGKQLAFVRLSPGGQVGLYVLASGSRVARRLVADLGSCSVPLSGSLSWSPDSSAIAVLGQSGCKSGREIWRVDVASGKVTRLRKAPPPPYSLESVAWSPNGRQIAFVESPLTGPGALSVINADGTGQRLIGFGVFDPLSPPSWAPDGDRLVYGLGYEGGRSPLYRIIGVRSGRGRRLTLPPGSGEPVWSPDGNWLAFGGADGVLLVGPDGKGLRRLVPSSYAYSLAWSPDSKSIAIERQGGTGVSLGPVDVWVVPIDGRRARRVTQGWRYGTGTSGPQWNPVGGSLASLRGPYVSPAFASDSLLVGNLLKTRHPVTWLAADGSRLALASDPGHYPPFSQAHDEVWDTTSKTITVLGDRNRCASGEPCFIIAIAGDRIAELFVASARTRYESIGLITGSLASPRMTMGTGSVCNAGGWQCQGVPIDDLLGSGSELVFDTWTPPCQATDSGCTRRPKTNGRLFRLDRTNVVQIGSSTGALTPLSVDAGRILVDHEDGTMDIRTADGSVIRSFTFDAAQVRGARLQGNDVVVETPSALEITDPTTGAFLRRWPLPAADTTLTDVQDGIAVLVAGTDIHLLRLSDGQDTLIHTTGTGPVLAQLEPAGLYYSYSTADNRYPGRVVFVPHNQLGPLARTPTTSSRAHARAHEGGERSTGSRVELVVSPRSNNDLTRPREVSIHRPSPATPD